LIIVEKGSRIFSWTKLCKENRDIVWVALNVTFNLCWLLKYKNRVIVYCKEYLTNMINILLETIFFNIPFSQTLCGSYSVHLYILILIVYFNSIHLYISTNVFFNYSKFDTNVIKRFGIVNIIGNIWTLSLTNL